MNYCTVISPGPAVEWMQFGLLVLILESNVNKDAALEPQGATKATSQPPREDAAPWSPPQAWGTPAELKRAPPNHHRTTVIPRPSATAGEKDLMR